MPDALPPPRRFSSGKLSLPVQVLLRFLLTALLVWALSEYLSEYVFISGGFVAYMTIGALLTLMNLLVRPLLKLITLPLKLVATILAIILVNGVFLWITYQIVLLMDPNIAMFEILGGVGGWIVVALILGIANWLMKLVLK
ncbi:MAG TPA: phage holin family protein [Candidatus Peribacteraceae bacterium]|nr:phage holin family protein [Candidatus Peribacteraceae bacterium]